MSLPGQEPISETYDRIETGFDNVESELDAATAVSEGIQAEVTQHKDSTAAHAAEHIVYTGKVAGAGNMKAAADSLQEQFDTAVVSGDSSPAADQARVSSTGTTYPTLKSRLDTERDGLAAQLAEKANQTDLNITKDRVESLEIDKLDKTGNIGVTQIDKTRGLLDQTYMSPEFLAQIAGTTEINAIPADYSLLPKQFAFPVIKGVASKNLFDKLTVTTGYYIDNVTGEALANAGFIASDYIPVAASTQYSKTDNLQCAFYDSSKVFISGLASPSAYTFTTPAGAAYMRVTVTSALLDIEQVELGNARTSYQQFNPYINVDDFLPTSKPVIGKASKNLFNKSTVTNGRYVNSANGLLVVNAGFFASDYIPVSASTGYRKNNIQQFAFYDASRVYISGVNSGESFTTPSNAAYVRICDEITNLNTLQLELGNVSTPYENFDRYHNLDDFNNDVIELSSITNSLSSERIGVLQDILRSLNNPFVRTNIKCLGDSITAGVAGTGYSATGELIGTTGQRANLTTATCWANMLRNNIIDNFNKEVIVALNHPSITNTISQGTLGYDGAAILKWLFSTPNTFTDQSITFDFYGDHFAVIHAITPDSGIMEVWVDGVELAEIDAYGVFSYQNETQFTGLALANHTVELKQTNRKNASSTAKTLYLEAIKLPKTATVKNWGVSGITSEWIYQNVATLVESTDDIVVLQIGTNDRSYLNAPEASKMFLRYVIDYVHALDKDIILMSANPTSVAQDNASVYFKMHTVDTTIRQIASEYNLPYISNYDHFIDYADLKGISIDSLIADEVHPNDLGYGVIYRNVARNIGLTILRDGITV
jgi:lysophospholipase L1-like esterase